MDSNHQGHSPLGFDRHGDCDLLSVENWSNLCVEGPHRRSNGGVAEIRGAHLNTLLVGVFQLLGSPYLFDNDFPGGVLAWEAQLDAVFVCLLQACAMEELLVRVFVLFDHLVSRIQAQKISTSTTNSSSSNNSSNNNNNNNALQLQYLQTLCNGAVSFLFFWFHEGQSFFRPEDLLQLHSFVVQLNELVLHFKVKSQAQSAFLSRFTSKAKGGQKNNSSAAAASAPTASPSNTEILNETSLSRLTQLLTALTAHTQQVAKFTRFGQTQNFFYPRERVLNPQLSIQSGRWTGQDKQEQKEKLKATFAAAPQVKLEIFGGDMLLDMSSSDEENDFENTNNNLPSNDAGQAEEKSARPTPLQPRIKLGVSLLSEEFIRSDSLLEMDLVELARQWTVIDHFLFQSLDLNTLLASCFTPKTTSAALYCDSKFMDSVQHFGGVKRIVDRFNAASLWISFLILEKETPEARAALITRFLQLADEFRKMGNYHALMVILTALQQGAVSRLRVSFDHVAENEMNTFQQLKKVMAAGKNYASYREEINSLMMQFSDKDEDVTINWRDDIARRRGAMLSDKTAATTAPAALLDSSANSSNTKLASIVPHLAAHTAALVYIAECYTDCLPELPHCLSLAKWRLCASAMRLLEKLQVRSLPLVPLRPVITALHFAWKRHFHRTAQTSTEAAQRLFALSEERESKEMIERYFKIKENPSMFAQKSAKNVALVAAGNDAVSLGSSGSSRIRRAPSAQSADAFKQREREKEGPHTLRRGVSRMFSSTFFSSSSKNRDVEEDEDEDDDDDNDDDEDEDEEENEEEDDEDQEEDGDEEDEEDDEDDDEDDEEEDETPQAKKRVLGIKRMLRTMNILKKK